MDTAEFLRKILPDRGLYSIVVIDEGEKPKHGYFNSIDEMAQTCLRLDERKHNVYYGISSLDKKRRLQTNVRATKVVAMDIDCGEGKPYATWREAAKAVGDFLCNTELPRPMFVASGRGLHIYWVFDRELAPTEWLPLAEALKALALSKGLAIDAPLTTNSALILRPVGTHNPKNGAEVRLLLDSPVVDYDALLSALPVIAPRPSVSSPLLANMAVEVHYEPARPSEVVGKCKQIAWAVGHQDEVDEPMWYSVIGVAAYCADPEETALAWSKGHPAFSEKDTLAKFKQWRDVTTGPTTCAKFFADRPSGCRGCKVKDVVKSPAGISVQQTEVAPTDNRIEVPLPFKRVVAGFVITIEETDVEVCDFDLVPVSYGLDEKLGYEVVRFRWERPHKGWTDLVFKQAYLVDGSREFAGAIADQGIVLPNASQTTRFQTMLRHYMKELKTQKPMTNLYSTMGWKEENSKFLLGDTMLLPDGKEEKITLSNVAERQGTNFYSQKGTLQQWSDETKRLQDGGLWPHMFAMGVGLSAPLYHFTGLKGITLSLHGPTGGGKSLAQQWVQSIYGDPEQLHFASKYTQYSLFNRLGMYCHLPMTVDEVTLMDESDVSEFCYWVTQGKDKARLNRNSEEQEAKTWATPVIVSTNISLQSKLLASKFDTGAQMARLLEIPVPTKPVFTNSSEGGRDIYQAIHGCYGHAGRAFIRKMLDMGEGAVKHQIQHATDTFHDRYDAEFAGHERYWEQAIILAELASRLASEWGLIQFDYRKSVKWILEQLGAVRASVEENKRDAFALLSEYMNDFQATTLTVEHTLGGGSNFNPYRLPKGEVNVRLDVTRPNSNEPYDRGTMMLNRTHFNRWMSARGEDHKWFREFMGEEGADVTPASKKMSLGKDTPIKIAQSYVIGLNLQHPKLRSLLDKASRESDDATMGHLYSVRKDEVRS